MLDIRKAKQFIFDVRFKYQGFSVLFYGIFVLFHLDLAHYS